MTWLTTDSSGRWVRGAALVLLAVLAWGAFVPRDLFWTAIVGAVVIGSAITTAVVFRRRSTPTLAQVITGAEPELIGLPVGRGHWHVARGRRGSSQVPHWGGARGLPG